MKRTYRYVEASGTVALTTEDGEIVEIPVVAGILKHLDIGQLTQMVRNPVVLVSPVSQVKARVRVKVNTRRQPIRKLLLVMER